MHHPLRLLLPALLLGTAPAVASPAHPVVAGFERFFTADKVDLARGSRLLVGELGCARCHQPATPLTGQKQPPVLDEVGGRVRGNYLVQFIADPQSVKPGTTMPGVLANDPQRLKKAEALAHFLASTGTLRHERIIPKNVDLGRDLYGKVGCVACHGTRNAKGEADKRTTASVPLGDLKAKYTLPALASFLENPLHTRPSGRMPKILNGAEAKNVASFLLQGLKARIEGKGATKYAYYTGDWEKLPDFAKLKPVATGKVAGFGLDGARSESNYALKFEGFFAVPRDGNYTFTLSSDDGSKLYVDDRQVVDNDGIHAPTTKRGSAKLTKGVHKVVVTFFQGGGGAELEVLIQGRGLSPRPLGDMVAPTEADLNKKPVVKSSDDAFEVNETLAAEGKKQFAALGCAACHQLKDHGKPIASTLVAPAWEKLDINRGCIAEKPTGKAPQYNLSQRQREAFVAGLHPNPKAVATPHMRVADTLLTSNCYACHVRDKVGGVAEELNKLILTAMPEMGDEGRLPPPLDGVGAKMRPDYLRNILDAGVHDRPYMFTRMPGFGNANVGHLVDEFPKLDKLPAVPPVTFKETLPKIKAQARHLVGGNAFGCIKCHTFAGKKAEGVQGIDMTIMTKRLQRDWFHAYVANPPAIRPGTRMPSAFTDGNSSLPNILGGSALVQIEAMWVYLSDGTKAGLPAGVVTGGIVLEPTKGAIMYRNFIQGAGPRAIAVGYPEKAHIAFDANELRLALLWQGAFMDAKRHWTGRGEGFEPPLGEAIITLHGGAPFAVLDKPESAWPTTPPRSHGYRFKGYRLTKDDRPTFVYAMNDVQIEDFCNPSLGTGEVQMKRTLHLSAPKPVENLFFRAAVGNKIEPLAGNWYQIDGTYKVKFAAGTPKVRKVGGKSELIVPVTFADGKAQLEYTFAW